MKINTNDFIVDSNVSAPVQNFSISDMSLVMELLSKLYNNPRQTLTQEYISNARDANRESGSTRPIEIKAPTLLDSTMIIRDYGLGISPDRMENVFKSYGTSTKRDTNNQVGGFGIGSKSAFSYTDSFTITTFIDGIKRDYLAHKTAKAGGLTLLSEMVTSEANGTSISIAVKASDLEIFRKAISRTTFFWSKQEFPVITGMEVVTKKEFDERIIDKTLSIYTRFPEYLGDKYYVVIDGIPYPMPRNVELSKVKAKYIYRIPNSVLNIAPNREALVENDHNFNTLNAISLKLTTTIDLFIKEKMTKDTFNIRNWFELISMFKDIPNKFGYTYSASWHEDLVGREDNCEVFSRVVFPRRGKSDKFRLETRDKADIARLYYDDIKESRLARLFRFKKIGNEAIYLINNQLPQGEFDKLKDDLKAIPLSQIDISDYIEPIKDVKVSGGKKLSNQVSISYYTGSVLQRVNKQVKDIPSSTVYISMEDEHYEKRSNSTLISYLKDTKVQFIFASKHTHEVLLKEKELISLDQWIKTYKVSDNEINHAIKHVLDHATWLQSLNKIKDKLSDKLLTSIVSYVSLPTINDRKEVPKEFSNQIDNHKDYIAASKLKDKVKTIAVKYPLLSTLCSGYCRNDSQEYAKDLIKYINSNASNKNV